MSEITNKDNLIMLKINKYFFNNPLIEKMIPIINGSSSISLRLIDWFVTNYSKKYNILLPNQFNVYLNYKKQLKAYTKKQFDPFCRRFRINYNYNNTQTIITTIGQLNFFRWAIKNGILDWIIQHHKQIEQDMNESCKINKQNKIKNLQQANQFTKHKIKITLYF